MDLNSEHFSVREAGPGIYALLAGTTGACVSNAAIIDLGDKTVVFDTFMTLPAADDLVTAAKALTGRGAFLAVNSHWHDDHTGGNQLFDGHPIVSTRRTAELIAEHGTFDPATYAEEIEGYLASAREQEARAETDDQRTRARSARMGAEALFAGKDRFRLTMPDTFIDDRAIVRGADREIEILTYGGGHTESDIFAYLPAEQVAIMGDLLWVDSHPRTNDGDAAAWADMLDRIGRLAIGTLVPGHGDLGSPQHLTVMADYLRHVERIVSDTAIPDSAVPDLPHPPGSESWVGGYRFADGVAALRAG